MNTTRLAIATALLLSALASPAAAETMGTVPTPRAVAAATPADLEGFTIFSRATPPVDPVLARGSRRSVPALGGTPTLPAQAPVPSPLTEPDTGLVVVAGLVAMLAATKKHRATSLVA